MVVSDVLLIKRLPPTLPKAEIEDFLKHIGAINVVVFESSVKKQIAFAKFKNAHVAKEALFRLHQQELFGSRLVVEFAKNNESYCNEKKDETEKNDDKKTKLYDTFMRNLNSWCVGLNFMLPPPCHLRYQYPPPRSEVLLNIVNMLSCSTKFYTQVLHLMNKMNLPSPFEDTFPLENNEIFNAFILYILENSVYEGQKEKENQSSDEGSELESDSEEMKSRSTIPQKRSLPQKKQMKRKKLFKPILTTATKVKTSLQDVFDQVERDPRKKIEVRIPSEISVTETVPSTEETSGFGVILPSIKDNHSEPKEVQDETNDKFISCEELATNRINERDYKILPIFKNYEPGIPSCRLYIKNLSKSVTTDDLNYIFKRYFIKGIDEQGTMFDIRLMQEGRMKGQAFVTLQSVKQAELALKETNGFIIKDKPMVVQFARSAVFK